MEQKVKEQDKKLKNKFISFRVDNDCFDELEKISRTIGVGTANNFVRFIIQTIVDSRGSAEGSAAADIWKVVNDGLEGQNYPKVKE